MRAWQGRNDWPLTGRDEALREATVALRRRESGGAAVVGEEGVGKSRLAAEVAHDLESHGVRVLRTVATRAAATLPFGALADLLPPDLQSASTPFDLMRLTVQRWRTAAPRQGLVVTVDDAHLLDEASAALVAHLVRSRAARALLVVREGVAEPDALTALLNDGSLERLPLGPLGPEDLARLCAEALGGPVEGSTLHRLIALCEGNVLYLRELVDAGLADGSLREAGGVWQAVGPVSAGRRLAQVVESRLGRLGSAERQVAELTAVAGTVEVDVLERLAGSDAVEEAERSQLVTVTQDGQRLQVRLSHPLYAEVLRTGMPRLAARRHHQRLAAELESTGCRRRGDVLRLALHRLDGGATPDESLLLQAAQAAASRFDIAVAVRLTTAAAEASGSTPARLAAAQALYAAGRSEEVEGLLAALQAEETDPEVGGRVALVRAANLASGFGRAADAAQVVRAASEAVDPGPLRDELAALQGMIALSRGRVRQALAEVEPLLSRGEAPERVTIRALLVAVSAWGQAGQADRAVRAAEKLLQDAADRELPAEYEAVLVGLCYAYGAAGRLTDAERLARSRYRAALDGEAADLRTLWALALGQAALVRGQVVSAEPHLREAALLLRHDQSLFGVHSLAWCLGCLAEAAGLRGDAAAARAALDEACAVTPEPCTILSRELARIWVVWAESTPAAAVREAVAVAEEARQLGAHVTEAVALHQAARLGQPAQSLARLEELAALVDGDLVPTHAAHARALASGDAVGLAAAADAYEHLGVYLDAAEAAAQAAVAHDRAGRKAAATRLAQRSAALASRCPGTQTPALAASLAAAALTQREQEIVALAARGRTSAEIAAALVLSARTVDNHLHHAYAKLGITSRRELAEVLGR